MIDCHTHAFPAPDHWATLLPGWPLGPVLESAERLATPLSQHLTEVAPRVALSFEGLAAFRRQTPGLFHQLTELLVSMGLGVPMLLTGTLDRLRASMAQHGIRRSVVIAAPPTASNEWLLDAVVGDPRLVPVAYLPEPRSGKPPTTASEWAEAWMPLAEGGAAGFKIHENMAGLPPSHAAWRGTFEAARATSRFVIIHTGRFTVPGYRRLSGADPRGYEPLLQEYPEVRVCLAHMNRDEPEVVWDLMRRYDQLFSDTSWQPAEALVRALHQVGADRLLLGSDWPLLHADLQGDALSTLRRAVRDDARLERITLTNAEQFLAG